ncbi:MAG: hypothetical protein ACP5OB_08850, partial [Candidatus Ratteibacteria bacterium]
MKKALILFIFNWSFCFGGIEGVSFRKVNELDKGTIYIYLKNETPIPLKIKDIYFNDVKIEKIPNELILCYQLTPPEI